jgi:multidrug resistance protein, MATE family
MSLLAENRRTLSLAAPIIAGLLGQMLMGVADTIMVGHVGVVPLAACAFANTVLVVPMVFGFGLLSSVSVEASHAHGEGRPEVAGEFLRGGILLAVLLAGFLALGAHASLPHLPLLRQPSEVNSIVGPYFLLCAWSFLPVFVTGAAKNFSEALEHPWPPFWIMLAGVGLNILLNWIFIYGNLGMPALGLDGAGLATLLSRLATLFGIVLFSSRSRRLHSAWPRQWFAPGLLSRARRLADVGIHSGGLSLCEVGGFSLGSIMMGWLGVIPLAAHQIAFTCAGTTFMVPLGLSQAVSVRVGRARGSGTREQIPDIVHGALALGIGIMSIFATCYFLMGTTIAAAFVDDPAVQALTVQLLLLAGVFQIFDGIQIVSSGALRGFADTRVPLLIGVLAYWGVALPVSWTAAFAFEMGACGVWTGFVVGLGTAAGAMFLRLRHRVSECLT